MGSGPFSEEPVAADAGDSSGLLIGQQPKLAGDNEGQRFVAQLRQAGKGQVVFLGGDRAAPTVAFFIAALVAAHMIRVSAQAAGLFLRAPFGQGAFSGLDSPDGLQNRGKTVSAEAVFGKQAKVSAGPAVGIGGSADITQGLPGNFQDVGRIEGSRTGLALLRHNFLHKPGGIA
ncbi:hypothetical protein HYW17_04215 [Candidatus Uhrbacteria bacterium]|nr:hypothetical protein [Candidatus Uhrbacteria bacterium]